MCIDDNQVSAIQTILTAVDILYNAVGHYTCERGNSIIAGAVRMQGSSEDIRGAMETLGEMLDKYAKDTRCGNA